MDFVVFGLPTSPKQNDNKIKIRTVLNNYLKIVRKNITYYDIKELSNEVLILALILEYDNH